MIKLVLMFLAGLLLGTQLNAVPQLVPLSLPSFWGIVQDAQASSIEIYPDAMVAQRAQQTQAARERVQAQVTDGYIVPTGLWSREAVLEAASTNAAFRQALYEVGINPNRPLTVDEIESKERHQTLNADLVPSETAWIEPGEAAWLVSDGSHSTLVRKSCGNPQVPPPPVSEVRAEAPQGAALHVRKDCSQDGNVFRCAQWIAVRVEAKGVPDASSPTGWWQTWVIVPPGVSSVDVSIPSSLFVGRSVVELTVSEEPSPTWIPENRWIVVNARPGDEIDVTFRNVKAGGPPEEVPSPTPSPTPSPSPTPTPPPPALGGCLGPNKTSHDCGHGNNSDFDDADNPGKAPWHEDTPPDDDEKGGEPGGASHDPGHPSGGTLPNTSGTSSSGSGVSSSSSDGNSGNKDNHGSTHANTPIKEDHGNDRAKNK